MTECFVCHRSKVPNYFLIKCIACARSWHHRCHSPPVPDQELIAIIRAFNNARARNPGATLNWKCGACRKVKTKAVDPAPNTPILIDDDDEVEIVQPPLNSPAPPRPQSHSKKSTSARVTQPVRIIDDPIDFLVSPVPTEHVQRPPSTLSSGIGRIAISGNQQEPNSVDLNNSKRSALPPSLDPEPHTQASTRPEEYLQAQLVNQETTSSTSSSRPRPRIAHKRSSNQPSNPTLASPLLDNSSSLEGSRINPGTIERPLLERWSAVQLPRLDQGHVKRVDTPPSACKASFHPSLLPHFINSRCRNSTIEGDAKKIDAWYLTALRKSKDAQRHPAGAEAAPDPSHPRRSKKSEAVRYKVNHDIHRVSRTPFYFSVRTWMKRNEDALTSFEAIASL